MKISELPSILCKREGKLKEVSVGNMREILAILSDLVYEDQISDGKLVFALYANGKRRLKRKKKK